MVRLVLGKAAKDYDESRLMLLLLFPKFAITHTSDRSRSSAVQCKQNLLIERVAIVHH